VADRRTTSRTTRRRKTPPSRSNSSKAGTSAIVTAKTPRAATSFTPTGPSTISRCNRRASRSGRKPGCVVLALLEALAHRPQRADELAVLNNIFHVQTVHVARPPATTNFSIEAALKASKTPASTAPPAGPRASTSGFTLETLAPSSAIASRMPPFNFPAPLAAATPPLSPPQKRPLLPSSSLHIDDDMPALLKEIKMERFQAFLCYEMCLTPETFLELDKSELVVKDEAGTWRLPPGAWLQIKNKIEKRQRDAKVCPSLIVCPGLEASLPRSASRSSGAAAREPALRPSTLASAAARAAASTSTAAASVATCLLTEVWQRALDST
jgi:hypothetical protein